MNPVKIGPATLFLGDAYELRPKVGFVDYDIMDPPYLFDNSGGGAWRAARGAADQIVEEGLDRGFDHCVINPLLCGGAMVFCHNDQLPTLLPYLNGIFHRFALLAWNKPNPAPHRNRHYLADMEICIHAWNRGYHPVGDHHDMHRFHLAATMPTKRFGHPTVKPASLMDKLVRNANGRSICDPFMGTGSTGVAAVKAGKLFYGIEQNPAHFDTAVKRITEAVREADNAQL